MNNIVNNNFPFICIDNFYNNPEKIRDIALNENFEKTKKGGFPGLRTKGIHEINVNLFNYFCARLFSLFYDLNNEKNLKWTVNTCFDISKNEKEGWVHTDDKSILVGLIYLSKNCNINSGTNFFIKNNNYNDLEYINYKLNYCNGNLSKTEYEKILLKHNSNYTKTLTVKNIFNRLIAYDPKIYHAPDIIDEKERLIQVFHVEKFDAELTPLNRMKRYD